MAADKNANGGKGNVATPEAPKGPDLKTLAKAWKDAKAVMDVADLAFAKALNDTGKEFNMNGIGIVSGAKAKGRDFYYVKVSEPTSPEDLSV